MKWRWSERVGRGGRGRQWRRQGGGGQQHLTKGNRKYFAGAQKAKPKKPAKTLQMLFDLAKGGQWRREG